MHEVNMIHVAFLLWAIIVVTNCNPIVETTCGYVQGVTVDGAFSFRGIPYAESPVGNLRWHFPVPLSPLQHTCWEGILSATEYGNSCFQRNPYNTSHCDGSEDCLYLNVWTPAIDNTASLPVMVWLHGGSLQVSNGNWPTYSPNEKLAKDTGIVYVSMNYRLHAFGFMALDILAQNSTSKSAGNYGFMDVIVALQWVQENIRKFGGDSNQVTLFGQSSGGTVILALLSSPFSKGLFHKAWVISSSSVLNKTAPEAYKDNEIFLHNTGCADVTCLYDLSPEAVTAAVPWDVYPNWAMTDEGELPVKGQYNGAIATVDGVFLPEAPLEAWANGNMVDVPLLIGTMANEINYHPGPKDLKQWTWQEYERHVAKRLSTFGNVVAKTALKLYPPGHISPEFQLTSLTSDIRCNCPNNYIALIAASTFTSPVYRYVGTSVPSMPIHAVGLPFAAAYSFHMWDVFAFFGAINEYIDVPSESDILWQENVRKEVLSFVHTGHPYSAEWEAYPKLTALLSKDTTPILAYKPVECAFWFKNGFFGYAWTN